MADDTDINWQIVLQHIQKAAQDNRKALKEFEDRMNEHFEAVDKRFDKVDEHFDAIEKRLEHLEQDVFVLVAQRKVHEEQLKNIEKSKLPKLRKSIRRVNKRLSEHIASPTPHPVLQA
jgi:chromosome segregation ATPase